MSYIVVNFPGDEILSLQQICCQNNEIFVCHSAWIFGRYLGVLRGYSSNIYPYWDTLAGKAIQENDLCLVTVVRQIHRHLRKIDWLIACTVCLISTVSGCSKKGLKCGANGEHTKKLEQSIDIFYGQILLIQLIKKIMTATLSKWLNLWIGLIGSSKT